MSWASSSVLVLWLSLLPALEAQGANGAAPGSTTDAAQTADIAQAADIAGAWDQLLANVIPTAKADPALVVEQTGPPQTGAADFFNHFFFETTTEYIRQETSFSGLSTPTGVINLPPGEIAIPDGIPYPPVFQPKWGMHLTPEAPRSSIRALEDHSRTLGEFQERFAFRFQIQPLPSPRGAQ